MPSTRSITFLRFIPENNNGIMGPDIATASAMRPTSNLALDTLISKCSAIEGNIPMTPISVVRIPKTSYGQYNYK